MDTITMLRMGKLLPAALCRLMENTMVFLRMAECMQIPYSTMKVKSIMQKRMEVFVRMSGVMSGAMCMVGCIVGLIERTIRMEFMR